jgi:hypothetical protein
LFKAVPFADRIILGEIAPIVPDVLMGLDLGHEIESHLRMTVLVRHFATRFRHLLAAFSMAGLPELRRKRPANAFVAMKHRGGWFCTDNRGQVFERFFNAASNKVNMVIDPLGGRARPILTVPVKSRQRCVLGLGWQVRTPHHLRWCAHNPN